MVELLEMPILRVAGRLCQCALERIAQGGGSPSLLASDAAWAEITGPAAAARDIQFAQRRQTADFSFHFGQLTALGIQRLVHGNDVVALLDVFNCFLSWSSSRLARWD